jgi:hypothetical protein
MNAKYLDLFEFLWSCLRNGIVHGSWPQAIAVRGSETDRILVGVNVSLEGRHLEPPRGACKPSLEISAAKLLVDIEASFTDGFAQWILDKSDDAVLDRAARRLLLINPTNSKGMQQFATIRGWTEGSR